MNKNTFLNELMSMNKDDIHKFIMEKGKSPKFVNAFSKENVEPAFLYIKK